jgi:ligand-binding SRPBCC domain-containing protein
MSEIYRLQCEMLVPVAMWDAFEVFQEPGNLERITPPWLRFRMLTEIPEMRRGACFEYQLSWLGMPMKWCSVISEYEPPFYFVDEMTKGPYAYWRHLHNFRPSEQGTIVSDLVEYSIPYGFVGRAVHRCVVAKQLREIFSFRQAAILDLIGEPCLQYGEPVIAEP